MRGWLVFNGFLQSEKFDELYAYLGRAAKGEGIELHGKRSTELFGVQITDFDRPDFVLFWDKDYVLAKHLEGAGLRLFNNAEGMRLCDDKSLTYLALEGRVRMPKTLIAPKTFEGVGYTDRAFLSLAAEELSFPMVVKECFGSFGRQVYLVHSLAELNTLVDGMGGKPFLMQEYIASSAGRDVRLNVVGGEVVSAMYRENPNDFRSNVTGGGTGKAYTPTAAQAELAVKACECLGLDFAGVDVMFGKGGEPILCEVNSNPHFKSTYDCTGKDMSVSILRHIKGVL